MDNCTPLSADDLSDAIELEFTQRCEFCGNEHSEYIETQQGDINKQIVEKLTEAGWMLKDSDDYACIQPCCPECVDNIK